MFWIKRNLYFVIGSLVAAGLMGFALFYLAINLKANNEAYEQWNQAYSDLKRLQELNPHPGDARVDNIKIAREQVAQLTAELGKSRLNFVPIPPIPDARRVSAADFTERLRNTINLLQTQARAASVTLPVTNYNFTFQSVVRKMTFSQTSLQSLAIQLGEVKAISEILFRAKVNALENLRREVCADDDPQNAPNDYLDQKSETNNLAVLAPYEVTFRCFSTELAAALAGFASSSNGFIVKTINIEPASPAVTEGGIPITPMASVFTQPVTPTGVTAAEAARTEAIRQRMLESRRLAGRNVPPVAPVAATPPVAPRTATPSGPETVVNEKPVKVTMLVEVIKLIRPAASGPAAPPQRQSARPVQVQK